MTLSLVLFLIITAVGTFAAVDIFLEKELYKSAISLSIAFLASAAVIFLLNQPLAALLQLLILVGGLSTYLIVAVASETKKHFEHTNLRMLFVLFLVLDVLFVYVFANNSNTTTTGDTSIWSALALAFSQFYLLTYLIALLLFSVAIGSIILMKRVIKIVV